jgi:NADPH:quinone reductase-like Zn-dependent oxidoreductase
VWGGASSVGLFTIQLARLSGYRVIATASPKNAELVKASGADVVLNYRDADVVEQIKAATDGGVAYGVDTVSLEDTQLASVRAFGPQGGELLVTLWVDEGAAKLRGDVQIKGKFLPTHYSFGGLTRRQPRFYIPSSVDNLTSSGWPTCPLRQTTGRRWSRGWPRSLSLYVSLFAILACS